MVSKLFAYLAKLTKRSDPPFVLNLIPMDVGA